MPASRGSRAKSSRGTKIKVGDGSDPEVFTLVPEAKNLSGPADQNSEIDATSYDSEVKEGVPDLPDAPDITFEIQIVANDPTHQQLQEDAQDPEEVRNYQIEFRDGRSATFAAWVKSFTPNAQMGQLYSASVALRRVTKTEWTYPA